MPEASLNGAQRVNRMLQRQDHDRVPRHDGYWPETIERWLGEDMPGAGYDDALQLLGSDFHQVGWCWPKPFPGRDELVSEDEQTRTSIDAMGNNIDGSGTLAFGSPRLSSASSKLGPRGVPTPACQFVARMPRSEMSMLPL
jgi:hypothetical protein